MYPSVAARLLLIVSFLVASTLVTFGQGTNPSQPTHVSSSAGTLKIEWLGTLEYPWGMASLPDGRILITEKPGRLRIWDKGHFSEPIAGVPKVVHRAPKDQGGLLDVEVAPDFAQTKLVYISYVEAAQENSRYEGETDDFRLNPDLTDILFVAVS